MCVNLHEKTCICSAHYIICCNYDTVFCPCHFSKANILCLTDKQRSVYATIACVMEQIKFSR